MKQIVFEDKAILQNLMELYQYDLSGFSGSDVSPHGLFNYKYLDYYWIEKNRHPFVVVVDGVLAGFVLIRQHNNINEIAEFFILRKFRGKGLGCRVAQKSFEMFKGNWHVPQDLINIPAQIFWKKVVAQYTKGSYECEENENHITLIFYTD